MLINLDEIYHCALPVIFLKYRLEVLAKTTFFRVPSEKERRWKLYAELDALDTAVVHLVVGKLETDRLQARHETEEHCRARIRIPIHATVILSRCWHFLCAVMIALNQLAGRISPWQLKSLLLVLLLLSLHIFTTINYY